MPRKLFWSALAAMSLVLATPVLAAEICGNGIDDDANGAEDEGCYPTQTTGVCESPLSCEQTGMISPRTGSLHYSLPPDVAPKVPWGPGIGFRRFYTSQYNPGTRATAVEVAWMREGSERENLIRQASKAGVSVAEVAARLGIPASTAYRWVRDGSEVAIAPSLAPRFVEVMPTSRVDARLNVRIGSAVIELAAGFDAALLRSVVVALEGSDS